MKWGSLFHFTLVVTAHQWKHCVVYTFLSLHSLFQFLYASISQVFFSQSINFDPTEFITFLSLNTRKWGTLYKTVIAIDDTSKNKTEARCALKPSSFLAGGATFPVNKQLGNYRYFLFNCRRIIIYAVEVRLLSRQPKRKSLLS